MHARWLVLMVAGCELASETPNTSTETSEVSVAPVLRGTNTEEGDWFGFSIAISGDGSTLAVGATYEDGGGQGVDPPDLDGWSPAAGAVYVFTLENGDWIQQAYIKASNTRAYNWFGTTVALSADGSTLAVGAIGESSLATGINGDQEQGGGGSGATYVFARTQGTWSQQAYIKPHRTIAMSFGHRVALSGDGNVLAVSAPLDWGADLFDGDQSYIGSVYAFTRNATTWAQEGYLQVSDANYNDMLGHGLALSKSGSLIAASLSAHRPSGAVQIFRKTGVDWHQKARVTPSTPADLDGFGAAIAFSPDASSLAVTAPYEQSGTMTYAGAAYLFEPRGIHWDQRARIEASDAHTDNLFGYDVALSSSSLVTGAIGYANGDPASLIAGSAYIFSTTAQVAQTAYLESPMPSQLGQFGRTVAIRSDGSAIVVGAPFEAGGGSVYVFTP